MSIIDLAYFSNLKLDASSTEKKEEGEVCIANISPLERQKRLRFGIQQFLFTLMIAGILVLLHLNPLWRLPLLFMFSASTVSFFQARDKTWVSLASRGARKFGEQEEQIEDQAELRQVRRQAQRVILKGFLLAIPITLIVYLLPL